MAITSLIRITALQCLTPTLKSLPAFINPRTRFLSTKPGVSPHSLSQYRKQISLANLLQRHGFPPSQLHAFLSRNRYLLNYNLHDIGRSLGILLSFRIPQKCLVSLVCDCPAVLEFEFLKKWQMTGLKFGDLSVSPLMIRNVLELSRRFQIEPDRLSGRVEILKGLGLNGNVVSKILEGFPKVIMMKESEIIRRIDFLMVIGIPRNGIEQVLYFFPEVLGFGIEDRLKPLLKEFWESGFSEHEIRKEIIREPRILSMELGEFSRYLELLHSLKCRVPIKENIFSEGTFRAGFQVKQRVDFLCKHGLIRREALKVLWKEPRLIIYEIEDIEKKIEFLVNRMKYGIGCLVEVPEYLGVNFEKQIVSRYNVIEYLKSKGALDCEVGLRGLIKPSRLRFYNLYVKPYPECEKMFGRFAGDVGVKRRHPAGLYELFKPQTYGESKQDARNIKSFMESLV